MKERNAALDKTERKESFFEQIQSTKTARKPLNVLQRFLSKLNEFNLTSQEDRVGVALKRSAVRILSK